MRGVTAFSLEKVYVNTSLSTRLLALKKMHVLSTIWVTRYKYS